MRSLLWVLLIVAGCKPASAPPEVNGALAAKLEAFGHDESNLEACLNLMRTANLFIGVKPNPNGSGGQAAIKVDPTRGQVLYAFLEAPAATTWWAEVEGVSIQPTPAATILDLAMSEQADLLIIEPQRSSRTMLIPRENFAPIAKAWGTLRTPDAH